MTLLGKLTCKEVPRTLELTDADALWAARMCVGEEADPHNGGAACSYDAARAIVSTMLRRWCSVNASRAAGRKPLLWTTFTDLISGSEAVHGYSLPICPKHLLETPDNAPALRARRELCQTIKWKDIALPVRAAVTDTLGGLRPLAQYGSGADHFASESFVARQIATGLHPDWQVVPSPAANAIVSTKQGRAITEPRVVGNVTTMPILVLFGVLAWSSIR